MNKLVEEKLRLEETGHGAPATIIRGASATGELTFAWIDDATGKGALGVFDLECPKCGPLKRTPIKRAKTVLRVWRRDAGHATFLCARCGIRGEALAVDPAAVDPEREAAARAEWAEWDAADRAERTRKARYLAARSLPAEGTVVETYLRGARAYGGPLPATIRFLPATDRHPPAMLALFGTPDEPEPGVLNLPIDSIPAVHLTRLRADGRGKAGTERDKNMQGPVSGWPIVLAPPNDLLGLVVCEGIETGLSLFEATGCGVWAAGAAGRMPPLADVVPSWIDTVTIAAEADDAGMKGARQLASRLAARGIHVEVRVF